MEKFQIKNGWITIEKPKFNSNYLSISMKLTEVSIITTERRSDDSYSIDIYGSNDLCFIITYFENEFEELNNDLKYIQEMISKT